MNIQEPEPGSTFVVPNYKGFPITRGQGILYFRTGWAPAKTWEEVQAWYQEALDDPEDDTTEPFRPRYMVLGDYVAETRKFKVGDRVRYQTEMGREQGSITRIRKPEELYDYNVKTTQGTIGYYEFELEAVK